MIELADIDADELAEWRRNDVTKALLAGVRGHLARERQGLEASAGGSEPLDQIRASAARVKVWAEVEMLIRTKGTDNED